MRGQKMISSTEWTRLSVASRSLWCSRLPPSPYPPFICPLIPDVRRGHPHNGPHPQPHGSDLPYRAMLLSLPPPKARQSLCGAPVGSTLLLRAWLWSTPICSQLHGQPQPATPGKGVLSPCSGHPGLSMNKALSIPFAHGQAHAGSSRSGAGASDPERASGVDSYRFLQMQPFM